MHNIMIYENILCISYLRLSLISCSGTSLHLVQLWVRLFHLKININTWTILMVKATDKKKSYSLLVLLRRGDEENPGSPGSPFCPSIATPGSPWWNIHYLLIFTDKVKQIIKQKKKINTNWWTWGTWHRHVCSSRTW